MSTFSNYAQNGYRIIIARRFASSKRSDRCMKKVFKSFAKILREMTRERFFLIAGFVSLFFLAASIALPVWRLFPGITERIAIPLHYNVHSGVDLFGPWQRIFTPVIISASILITNSIIAIILWKKEKVLSYFLIAVAMLVQVFLFVSMIFVVLLNLTYD